MANQNEVDIEIPDQEDLGTLDESTDWKAKAEDMQRKHREAGIRNRERTKALKDELATFKVQPIQREEKKSSEFGLLEKGFLRSAGYIDSEEIALFQKWGEETKKTVDELIDHPFVKAEIEKLRTAKANMNATSDVKGDGAGISGDKNTPEYWIAKGTYPEPTSQNLKLREAIIDKMMEREKTGGKTFYND